VQRPLVLIASLFLSGCVSWSSPWGIFVPDPDAAIAPAPKAEARPAAGTEAALDDPEEFVITTGSSADPRTRAQDFCTERSRYARLVSAQRIAGATPEHDTIRWYFDCIY